MIERFCSIVDTYFKNEDIKVIFDLGSRDLDQSIEFSKRYGGARVYAFECFPQQYNICLDKAKNYNKVNGNGKEIISVSGKAVHEYDGKCDFYCIDVQKHNNYGASSLFKASGKYDNWEPLPQYKIEVECTRLDTFCKINEINDGINGNIDLIWMDLQGGELSALKGLGNLIRNVKAIYTEVEYQEIYTGQALFKDIDSYLVGEGFELELISDYGHFKEWSADAIYVCG